MKIKIINSQDWNWYKDLVGMILFVKDENKYGNIGIQVFRPDNKTNAPDVISYKDFEYVN